MISRVYHKNPYLCGKKILYCTKRPKLLERVTFLRKQEDTFYDSLASNAVIAFGKCSSFFKHWLFTEMLNGKQDPHQTDYSFRC